METSQYAIILLSVYLIGLTWILKRSLKQDDGQSFIIGNRNIGSWDIFGSVISYMRAGSNLVFWFSFVAMMGFGSIWILVSFYTGFILMTLLAPLAQKLSHEKNYITFPDLIEDRQGRLMSLWVIFFSFYTIVILTVSQLFVMGNVLGGILDINTALATCIGAGAVAAYIVMGGFLTVVRTDVFQALIIVLVALGFLLFGDWPEALELKEQLITPNWHLVVGFGLIGFAVPASTDMWQRFFAVKKASIIVPSVFSALVIDVIIVLGLILFIQNILSLAENADPSAVFTGLFSKETGLPFFIALFGVFIISAVMSTIDNQIFNFTSIATKNIFKVNIQKDRKKFISLLRIFSIASLAIFTICSLTIQNLMQWIIDTYAFVAVITPFVFYAVIINAYSDRLLATGVFISSLSYWLLYILEVYANMYWYMIPYFIPLLFILLDFLLGKSNAETKHESVFGS